MIKIVKESNSNETSNAISTVIEGMQTTLSELDMLIMDSANSNKLLVKKNVLSKVVQLGKSLSTIRSLLKSYTPDNRSRSSK